VKPSLAGEPNLQSGAAEETRLVAAWAFDQILIMLHPLMPFITEELWHAMGDRTRDLIVSDWPTPQAQADPHAKANIEKLIELTVGIRRARNDLNVPVAAYVEIAAVGATNVAWLTENMVVLRRLSRVQEVANTDTELGQKRLERHPSGTWSELPGIRVVTSFGEFQLPLEGVIDLDAEKARLSKALEASAKEANALAARLSHPNFTERAKPEAVEKARADHEAKAAEAERLRAALERLG
jgi:valyl-tRNA synthetase